MQYKSHVKFNILIALPLLAFVIYYFFKPETSQFFTLLGSFTYATLFMNPDLDMANQIKLFSIKGVLTIPFRSYALIFRHRGISHSIFWGTLSRVLWLLLFFIVAFYLCDNLIFLKKNFILFFKFHKHLIFSSFIGILIADLCHLLLDNC